MLFAAGHELGHGVIREFELPVLGREEDAADSFAIFAALQIGTEFSHRVLMEAVKGWFLGDKRDKKLGEKFAYLRRARHEFAARLSDRLLHGRLGS